MSDNFLIYGSYGYTGDGDRCGEAVARGLRPILAGPDRSGWRGRRPSWACSTWPLAWTTAPTMDWRCNRRGSVLDRAGPFSRTTQPMVDGCLRSRVHYLDITGEIVVFEALAGRGAEAQAAGVMLLPGAGFDVVPSDCPAADQAGACPRPTGWRWASAAWAAASRAGMATTGVESIGLGHLGAT